MRLRGIAKLAGVLLVLLACPWPAQAAPANLWPGVGLALRPVAAVLQAAPESLLGTSQGLGLDGERSTALRLPQNLELNISVLYRRDPSALDPKGRRDLLYNYSLDYRLMPNLQVGLNGYLYHPQDEESYNFLRPTGQRVLGLGPELRYNLGRWNFVFKSQVESGGPKGEDLQNWFRVWYAF